MTLTLATRRELAPLSRPEGEGKSDTDPLSGLGTGQPKPHQPTFLLRRESARPPHKPTELFCRIILPQLAPAAQLIFAERI